MVLLKGHWTYWLLPLAVGGFLGSSLAFPFMNMARQEEELPIQEHEESHSQSPKPEKEFAIVMQESGYHIFEGDQSKSKKISIVAGEDIRLSIRNEDTIAHEAISPLFMRADIRIEGRGIGLFRNEAGGFRLRPGDSMTTQFKAPFFEFESFYDLIWCARHESQPVKGKEVLVIRTESQSNRL